MKKHLRLMSVLCLTPLLACAHEAPTQTAQKITFNVQTQRQVERDVMQLTLFVEEKGADLKALSASVNEKMNQIVNVAKKLDLPKGTVSRNTYVNYNKKSEIESWVDRGQYHIESHDFNKLGQLITQLSGIAAVDNINFSLSKAKRQSLEQEMTAEAIATFKQKAQFITEQLGAKGYRIVDLTIGSSTNNMSHPYMVRATTTMYSAGADSMPIEAGETDVNLGINATINLTE